MFCPPHDNITHGTVHYTDGSDLYTEPPGEGIVPWEIYAYFSCDDGYELPESIRKWRRCVSPGVWAGPTPTCVEGDDTNNCLVVCL